MARSAEAKGTLPNVDDIGAMMPLKRVGTPDDVAAACDFLCSDDAGYITGAQTQYQWRGVHVTSHALKVQLIRVRARHTDCVSSSPPACSKSTATTWQKARTKFRREARFRTEYRGRGVSAPGNQRHPMHRTPADRDMSTKAP